MTQKEIDELWYSQNNIPGVQFRLNDPVKIITGIHKNECAYVISILELVPLPKYSIELEINGELIEEYENNLELFIDKL